MTIAILNTPLMTANLLVALARAHESARSVEVDAVLAEPTPEPNPVGEKRTMREIVWDMIATA